MTRTLMAAAIAAMMTPGAARAWDAIEGDRSAIHSPRRAAVSSAAEWETLWREHAGDDKAAAPAVDFAAEMVVAVFLGERPEGGYSVSLRLVQDPTDRGALFVLYAEKRASGSFALQRLCQPFQFRRLPRRYASVLFEADGRLGIPEPELRSKASADRSIKSSDRFRALLGRLETVPSFDGPIAPGSRR